MNCVCVCVNVIDVDGNASVILYHKSMRVHGSVSYTFSSVYLTASSVSPTAIAPAGTTQLNITYNSSASLSTTITTALQHYINVTVHDYECLNPRIYHKHALISCEAPVGVGVHRPVSVSFPSLKLMQMSVAVNVSYFGPIVTAVKPLNGSAVGGFTVTVTGMHFGGSDFGAVVYFDRYGVCNSSEWISDRKVICHGVPEGAGDVRVCVCVCVSSFA